MDLCLTVRVVDGFANMGSVPGYRKATEISLVGIGAAECLWGNQLTHRSGHQRSILYASFHLETWIVMGLQRYSH